MIELLDSTGFRIIGYLVVAAVALFAGFRERREVKVFGAARWPAFCFIAAILVFALFAIRWRDFDDQLANIGREQAVTDGWYNGRRLIQTAVILTIGVVWTVVVALTIWRVPSRRLRYLPAAVMLPSMFALDAVRAISFHDLDILLYQRPILGFRLIAILELGGQAATAAAFLWHPFSNRRLERPGSAATSDQPSTAAGAGGR